MVTAAAVATAVPGQFCGRRFTIPCNHTTARSSRPAVVATVMGLHRLRGTTTDQRLANSVAANTVIICGGTQRSDATFHTASPQEHEY